MNYFTAASIAFLCLGAFAQNPISVTTQTNATAMTTTIEIPFEQSSTNWSAERLVYGPIELLAGALTPVGGMLAGGAIGALIPIQAYEKPRYFATPYTAVAGAVTGTALGAMIAPVVIVEGVFDTLTGGYFARHPFAWFAFSSKSSHDEPTVASEAEPAVESESEPMTDPNVDLEQYRNRE